ncbi:hypothetical protein CMQ_3475 [Grosmannia clavigera kw1407]|uniref:Uncharacterized protein n=1 Tax=Grosmannia clavigera (strain kw1407 / UAMH 11150) TaxID=655863 RepID=F0X8H7_GROCL|nr:uncharacterized protein CMQ_3475 [Grosmannia clavigera kw1407]EFX05406.1 hypothetical protein CMQ_3475 [Grosmannia clavigera kw1407]
MYPDGHIARDVNHLLLRWLLRSAAAEKLPFPFLGISHPRILTRARPDSKGVAALTSAPGRTRCTFCRIPSSLATIQSASEQCRWIARPDAIPSAHLRHAKPSASEAPEDGPAACIGRRRRRRFSFDPVNARRRPDRLRSTKNSRFHLPVGRRFSDQVIGSNSCGLCARRAPDQLAPGSHGRAPVLQLRHVRPPDRCLSRTHACSTSPSVLTTLSGLEEHRKRQATSKGLRHKSRGKHYASSSASSLSRHPNGMVVTRYPPPPSVGEPQITRYPPHHQLSHLPPPPPMSLLPPPPPSANGGSYHGYHPQHHALPPHPPPRHQPGPEPWKYPPQQPAYPGPHSSVPAPPHYPHYDTFGQSMPGPSPHAPRSRSAPDSSYYSQSYPPQPGYFASPPSGVKGPSVIPPPPSFASAPYYPQPPHLSHPLPQAPHHQPPSGLSQPGTSEPYAHHEFGRPLPQSYPLYGSPPSNLPNTPRYPQGSGSGNGWRPGKRGDFTGPFHRGGRASFGKDRGGRRHYPANANGFRHSSLEHSIGGSSIPTGPAALSRRFAATAPDSERRAPSNDAASGAAPSQLASPAVPNGIPAKPPTPISMSRSGLKKGGRPHEAVKKAELDHTSSQSSPNTIAESESLDPHLSSQKRTNDSHLTVDDDRGIKRNRLSPTDWSAPGRQSVTPVLSGKPIAPVSDTPTSSHADRKQDEDGAQTHDSSPSKNSLPNPPNGSPWSSRPPNRVLSYGTSDHESSGTSTRHDSGYHSNDGAQPVLAATKGSAAVSGLLVPSSRSGFSRSRSSSPLDDLELAMLGMVRPESDEENEGLQKPSDKSGGNQKIRKRQQPRVATAYRPSKTTQYLHPFFSTHLPFKITNILAFTMGSNHSTQSSKKQGSRHGSRSATKQWERQQGEERLQRALRDEGVREFMAGGCSAADGGHRQQARSSSSSSRNNKNSGLSRSDGLSRTSNVKYKTAPRAAEGSRREQQLAEQASRVQNVPSAAYSGGSPSPSVWASGQYGTTRPVPPSSQQPASSGPRCMVDPSKNQGGRVSRFREEF